MGRAASSCQAAGVCDPAKAPGGTLAHLAVYRFIYGFVVLSTVLYKSMCTHADCKTVIGAHQGPAAELESGAGC